MNKRTFRQIAKDIKKAWPKVYFDAEPYLEALLELNTTNPEALYYCDRAKEIAEYFLANAQTFRGEEAKRLKEELKALIR